MSVIELSPMQLDHVALKASVIMAAFVLKEKPYFPLS
jgi:hypothetical protein